MLHSKNIIAIPPGETIREQLGNREMSQKEFALRMGMTEKHISQLINGKVELTPDVAVRLETVLGLPANYWNNLEMIYRDKLVRVKKEKELEEDCEVARQFPYSKMANCGWVPKTQKIEEKAKYLRSFFEVAHLGVLDELCVPGIAYRKMGENSTSDYALAAWAQRARIEARGKAGGAIDIRSLNDRVQNIRDLVVKTPNEFCPNLRALLSECGVVLVFLPHIGGSFLHGASFVDGKHIVLGLTVRGKDADRFWFSLFHELFHVLEGHVYNKDGASEEEEISANKFAADVLIPPEEYQAFINEGDWSKEAIISFAKEINSEAGIVLGRLQKENKVPYSWYKDLKKQYEIKVSEEA